MTIGEFKNMVYDRYDSLSTRTKKVVCLDKEGHRIDCALYEPITLARMIEINIMGNEDDDELYAHTYDYGCMPVIGYFTYGR